MSTPYDSTQRPTDPPERRGPETGTAPTTDEPTVPLQATRPTEERPDPAFVDPRATRETVLRRERREFGGLKIGSAFFGWLTATGAAILLTGLVTAAGTAVGVAVLDDVDEAVEDAATIGAAGAILLLVILFVSYLAGGYVAGRMARFRGALQGVGVWGWAVVVAVVVAVVGYLAGEEYDVLAEFDAFPRIPLNEGDLTTAGWIAIALAAVVSLAGAVLGGGLGTRYHRKVDRAGFGG